MDSLLDIGELEVEFSLNDGAVRAVKGVSFTVGRGETLCLVGESGSGKSLTVLSVLNLLPAGATRRMERAIFAGQDISRYGERQMQDLRGRAIGMIFQDPTTAFNPTMTIGRQLEEVYLRHVSRDRRKARERAIGLMTRVGVTRPETRMDEYPHQLSGGLRQRAMIAMALMCEPKLLIADEPTTALDVTMQAQVLSLLKSVQESFDIAILFITHDLGVVAAIADRIAVMKSGVIVEMGDVDQVLGNPREAYTKALIAAVPKAPVLDAIAFEEAGYVG